ncbi:MAG: hypothetical protein ACON3Z_15740 [Bradymonadia bacterium]
MKILLRAAYGISVLCFSLACDEMRASAGAGLADVNSGLLVTETGPLLMSLTHHDGTLYVAGGARGAAGGRLYKRSEGVLQRLDIPVGRLLWWVWSGPERLFACGEGGRIIMFHDGVWRTFWPGADDRVTFWGGWTRADGTSFVVGGSRDRYGPKGLVYYLPPGSQDWLQMELPMGLELVNHYKIWGAADGLIYIVGERGVVLVIGPDDSVCLLETGTQEQLFTVHGSQAGDVFVVGGLERGLILRLGENGFVREELAGDVPALSGVFVSTEGVVYAVGDRGTILMRDHEGRWQSLFGRVVPDLSAHTFHAVRYDGGLFAVGGRFKDGEGSLVLSRPEVITSIEDWDSLPEGGVMDRGLTETPSFGDLGVHEASDGLTTSADMSVAYGDGSTTDYALQGADGAISDCGNGVVDTGEACDDGNHEAGDGCDRRCAQEPRPIGAVCEYTPCADGLECLGVAAADFEPVCTLQCEVVQDCWDAGFSEDVVCDLIGPQLIDTYCVPVRCLDGQCG